MKILIVDDDKGIVELIREMVEELGLKAEIATKANEARKKIEIFVPDLILLIIRYLI